MAQDHVFIKPNGASAASWARHAVAGVLIAAALPAGPARAAGDDGVVRQFFGIWQFFVIWDDAARVTPARVRELYAGRVVYYGHAMNNAGVYAEKLRFIRRWPDRRYAVVPGTLSKGCGPDQARCAVSTVLRWTAASPARGAAAGGWTRVTLDLVRDNGELRIARESGHPVPAP